MKPNSRQFIFGLIICFYLIPFLYFAFYTIGLMPPHKSWPILSLGLLLIPCGSLILMLVIYYREEALKEKWEEHTQTPPDLSFAYASTEKEAKVTSLDPSLSYAPSDKSPLPPTADQGKALNLLEIALKETEEQRTALQQELEWKKEELYKLTEENKQAVLKAEQALQDFADYKLFSEEQLKQKNLQIASLQQTLEDQRTEMEKRQEQIYQLDTKVHDLSYEIKTLLYLHEADLTPSKPSVKKEEPIKAPFPDLFAEPAQAVVVEEAEDSFMPDKPIKTAAEACALLRKCINIAQKLTGAHYYSNEISRYRDFPTSHSTIDQRRLFDNLRAETSGLIIVYSQKDQKLLFANNQTKSLLGWSSDKFLTDFSQIMQEGLTDWKRALSLLASFPESQSRLLAKTKQGHEILLDCHLGSVPTGLFKNYVIGVLYPT